MKLYESIYILERFSETIEALTAIMVKHEYHRKSDWSKQDTIHYVTLYQNILMDVNSYIDEYENYLFSRSEDEFKERILIIKKISKPTMDKIKKWRGLEELRNEMIAHNWREKGTGNIIIPKIGSYDTPRNFHDLLYLQTYITLIQIVISAEFHKETPEIWPYIESIQSSVSKKPISNPNYEHEIRALVKIVNDSCVEFGRDYRIDEEAIFLLKHSE